jgi:hypothetical protein
MSISPWVVQVGGGQWAVGGIYGRMDESGEMRFKV